ncbi:hypothetical protein [Diaphorobacter nitroreducens]
MNDTKQPEALMLADRLDANASGGNVTTMDEERAIAQTLRRLHAENTTLHRVLYAEWLEIEARNKQLVKEAARTAEEKLRADRMTEQHRMQCQMREGLEREIEVLRKERGMWHQEPHPPTRLCGCKDCVPSFEGENLGEYPPLPWGSDFEEWLEVRSESAVHDAFRAYVDADRAMRAQAAPAAVAVPSEDVRKKIETNTWDHFGDILPTLKAISRGEWYWGANSRCKYIEIRLDTRDGGCILYDRDRVRISPEQFAFQAGGGVGKMEPWPAKNALAAAPTTQEAPEQEAAIGARCKVIENCKSCQHSVGRQSCALADRKFDSLSRSSAPPEWCPLPLYTAPQPAPVAQGDAEDAARYRWLRCSGQGRQRAVFLDSKTVDELDAAIDAARAQAKEGGA